MIFKIFIRVILFVIVVMNLSACTISSNSKNNDGIAQTIESTSKGNSSLSGVDVINYSDLKGNWAYSPRSKVFAMNYQLGGLLMKITEASDNHLKGSIMQIQSPPSNRVAEVQFDKELKNNFLEFDYKDDGFGSSGHCTITIIDSNSINLSIQAGDIAKSNTSGWRLTTRNCIFNKVKDLKENDMYVQFVKEYVLAMVNAINENKFILVKPYLINNSPLFKSQDKLITNLFNQGIKEELISCEILSIEDFNDNGRDSKRIKVHEKYYIINSNDKKEKEFDYYYFAGSGDELRLYDISGLSDERTDFREKSTPEEVLKKMVPSGCFFDGVDYATGRYILS